MTRIAVASGKGGTGKTTVATSLAVRAALRGRSVAYADCDVEEPNGHLFLHPRIEERSPVALETPVVVEERCNSCGRCGEVCAFSAIVTFGDQVMTFPELCHSCGGCWLACPEDAIRKGAREVGVLERGRSDGSIGFVHGVLRIGEAMAPPLIRAVTGSLPEASLQILDAPPGTSCPVIQTVRAVDYVLLVTEPTPFGLHDLKLAVGMLRELEQRFGVVVNRADVGGPDLRAYCQEEGLEILGEIPDDRAVAEAYARGEIPARAIPAYGERIDDLLLAVLQRASPEDGADTGKDRRER